MEQQLVDAFGLHGRTAVVMGAGGGLGREAALTFAAAGAAVVVSDLPGDALAETEQRLLAAGAKVQAVPADVRDKAAVQAVGDAALDATGRIDVWTNVAAILRHSPVVDTPEADLDDLFAVNVKGTYFGCQTAARAMVAAGRGSIINFASQAIDTPVPGNSVYSLTKAAIAMLTKSLAVEVGPSGVRANVIAPGFIDTPMNAPRWTNPDGSIDEERRRAVLDALGALNPLRTSGEPIDIALPMLFLASDASRFVTGQVLRANGGGAMP
jgi:3-oxoacyl-[acyl-carrier protein] reductase